MFKRILLLKNFLFDTKSATRDLYFLLAFLLFSVLFISVFDPLQALENIIVANSNHAFDNIVAFLLISSLGLCLYSLRRWKEVHNEASKRQLLESELLEIQSNLVNKVQQQTTDLENATSLLDNRNRDLELLSTLTETVHNSLDVDDVCNSALELITTLDYVDMACIYMVDYGEKKAELKYHENLPPEYLKNASSISHPTGITWKVIETEKPELIEDTSANTDLSPVEKVPDQKYLIALPMKIENVLGGVLWISSNMQQILGDRETKLLNAISGQLSFALTRAKVYKELYKKNRYEKIVNSVGRLVHGSINLDEVLENAVEALSVNVVKAQSVAIYLVEGDGAVLKTYRGYTDEYVEKIKFIPYREGITWKAIGDKKPVYCPDAENDEVLSDAAKELGTKSYLSMPIKLGTNTVGTINITSLSKNAFDDEELKLLDIVSSQVETAINNAKYAEALRKSEELLWQKISQLSTKSKYDSIIKSISDKIQGSADLQEVLENAVDSIKNKIDPIEYVALQFVEGGVALLKAHRGLPDWYVEKIKEVNSPRGIIWKTISLGKTVNCADAETDDVIEQEERQLGTASYISIPLYQEDNVVGALSVSSLEKNAFNKDDLDILEMVSKQIETAITKTIHAEILSSSEERYRTLYEQSPLGVYLFDKDLRITNCNDRMCELIGSPKDMIIGLDMNGLKDKRFIEVMKRALRGDTCQHEGFYETTTSGRRLWLSISLSPLWDKDRNVKEAMALVEDRTQLTRANEEVSKAQRLESLGVLAGGIAHDFNNILTAVLGSISIAKYQSEGDGEMKGILSDAESAAIRAKDLTLQLLTFAKGGEPVRKLLDIGKVVNESSAFALTGSNIKLNFNINDKIWFVEADEGQINQVFNNIVINAQQAMPEGGYIDLKFENTENPHPSLKKGKYVKVSVADQGIGISEDHLSKIFDPYFTTKNRGTGLGLSTSHSIIEKHGGLITAESTIGKGSTFNVFLPASENQFEYIESENQSLAYGKGRVLIMDDEKVVRDAAGAMLIQLGYQVGYSVDGDEALRTYKDAKEKDSSYDVVILDLTIPGGMGGKQAIEKLRSIDPSIKAIVSSGYSNNPVMADYKNYGFSGILPKPYTIKQLGDVLNDVIRV